MPFPFQKSNTDSIESDRFNIALGYVTLKVLQPWVECDKHIKIALYGAEDINDSLNIPEPIKIILRLQAIDRLKENLKALIEDTNFLMNKNDKLLYKTFMLKMERYDEALEKMPLFKNEIDMITHKEKIVINEKQFTKCLNYLREIKKEIGKPLHRANLIFKTDEFDFDALKKKIINGG